MYWFITIIQFNIYNYLTGKLHAPFIFTLNYSCNKKTVDNKLYLLIDWKTPLGYSLNKNRALNCKFVVFLVSLCSIPNIKQLKNIIIKFRMDWFDMTQCGLTSALLSFTLLPLLLPSVLMETVHSVKWTLSLATGAKFKSKF